MIDNPDEGRMQNKFTIARLIKIFCLPLILLFSCVHVIEVDAMAETKEKVGFGLCK